METYIKRIEALEEVANAFPGVGESYAIREMLGHAGLPDFVGDMSSALYRREA